MNPKGILFTAGWSTIGLLLFGLTIAFTPLGNSFFYWSRQIPRSPNLEDISTVATQGKQDQLVLAGDFESGRRVKKKSLDEISGITSSAFSTTDLWVHNDSGGKPNLYLLNKDGKRILTVKISNAKNKDWEDLARFEVQGVSYLLIADVGDNGQNRKSVRLLIIKEPNAAKLAKDKVSIDPVATIQFQYPDGPQNCESVAVSGDSIYLINKNGAGKRPKSKKGRRKSKRGTIYRLPLKLEGSHRGLIATRVGLCPLVTATAMDISIDGRWMIVRDYWQICLYYKGAGDWAQRLEQDPNQKFLSPLQRQSESICFSADGSRIWTTSEGRNPVIWSAATKVLKGGDQEAAKQQPPKATTPDR